LRPYVTALWREQKYPTIRRLKKLGLQVWVESGGDIAARYAGTDPFDVMAKTNWQRTSLWKHRFWWWQTMRKLRPEQEPEGSLYEWSRYMVMRIATVLDIKDSQRDIRIGWPKTAAVPGDLTFTVQPRCIQ